MSFVTFVSGRYLRTRQKRTFISLITVLSIAGVTVGVMALIVVIAVMAGFENDLKSRIMGIRPHLVLTKKQGVFSGYKQILARIKPIGEIETASAFITTQVVLRTTTRAAGAILKGTEPVQGNSGIDSRRYQPVVDTRSRKRGIGRNQPTSRHHFRQRTGSQPGFEPYRRPHPEVRHPARMKPRRARLGGISNPSGHFRQCPNCSPISRIRIDHPGFLVARPYRRPTIRIPFFGIYQPAPCRF